MNSYRNFMLLAVVQLVCFVSILDAYASGDVEEACSTMAPLHEGTTPSNDTCPYETVPDVLTILQGESLVLTLRNISTSSFKGYMTMAFDASKPDEAGPIGTFGMPSDGQLLNCPEGVNNTISHNDNNSNKKNVTATWTAPADFVGTVVFKTTFVKGEKIYWVKEPSDIVTVIADDTGSSTEGNTSESTSEDTTNEATTTEASTTEAAITEASTTGTTTTKATTTKVTTTGTTTTKVSSTGTTTTKASTTVTTTLPPCAGASSLSYNWIGIILPFLVFARY